VSDESSVTHPDPRAPTLEEKIVGEAHELTRRLKKDWAVRQRATDLMDRMGQICIRLIRYRVAN
jgi:hypothetical protein